MLPGRDWFPRRLAALLAPAVCAVALPVATSNHLDWPVGGHDVANTRSNPFEKKIDRFNASDLTVKWTIPTQGEISATPAVVDGAVYFPDWAGYLTKADASSGRVIWSRQVSEYTGLERNVSRTSPAVSHGIVYIGDQGGSVGAGARLMAIDAQTGDLVWSRLVDDHPAAQLTQAPMVHDGVVYQGVSSVEFALAGDPDYPCCTFRGNVVALDAATGRILWRTYTVPDNGGAPGGYSGASVWGGTPAIDPRRGRVYVTTGNNYTVPQEAKDCQNAGGTPAECLSPDDHVDSVLALDMRTGAIEWAAGPEIFDDWNGGCLPGFPPDNCPDNPGPDWDFGTGAQLFVAHVDGRSRRVVGAGQKSGQYWLLDARTGEILWSAAAGPGGVNGGIQWGTATDGRRIYLAEANFERRPYELPNGQTIDYGSFAALDPATGRILWQTADPSQDIDTAAVTVANGVMYAGSLSGRMFALDAATGDVLWDFQGDGPSAAGPAVVDGTVYWGNGYPNRLEIPSPPSPSTFYAFSVPA
ncbi:MAG: PQQ-binding-like beta-propeller repeat protein [Streptosporangiales bacterium]|nr:PQQ-binding-like beta-propeller repeat protein [Streptosporangiales bacterium]